MALAGEELGLPLGYYMTEILLDVYELKKEKRRLEKKKEKDEKEKRQADKYKKDQMYMVALKDGGIKVKEWWYHSLLSIDELAEMWWSC